MTDSQSPQPAHTPGPWIAAAYGDYGDYDGKCRVILGEGGDIRTAVVLGFNNPENAANARLIAAAPELLAVLREFRDQFDAFDPSDKARRHAMRMTLIACDAAIAKATGAQA